MILVWSVHGGRPGILRVLIPHPGEPAARRLKRLFPDGVEGSCLEVDAVAEGVEGFLSGDDIRFFLDIVRMDLCPPFQREVLRACHAIPRGRVGTYGRIAARLGSRGAARAVGTALAMNPFPLLVPCHRTIRSDGTPGGFGGGPAMKRALLSLEGVRFQREGRVVPDLYFP